MIETRLAALAPVLDARQCGPDTPIRGASTDTRTLAPGALFVALRGARFDGHAFLAEAQARGAAAALVEEPVPASTLPQLVVGDSREALGRLAAFWRARFEVPLIAVTGSNGKTTVKEMLAGILRMRGPVLATRGNLNNDIGVPLTLLELAPGHRAAVIEMGANHPGEIALLAGLARPTVGVITQCAPAHLEGFGTVAGVARAKGELLAHLDPQGTAVINLDDPYAPLWRELAAGRRCIGFALDRDAEVTARWQCGADGTELHMRTPAGSIETRLALPGRHNVANALAAAAAAGAAGAAPSEIAAGLAAVRPVRGRLELKAGLRHARLIDDTYNANPASLEAGLAVLAAYPGRRWLVLGDMGELGPDAPAYHERVGRSARRCGIERLYAAGVLSKFAAAAFGDGGRHFADRDALVTALREDLGPDTTVLVKGSRAMQMERVVAALGDER